MAADMKESGKEFEVNIYPRHGKPVEDGHAFGYVGTAVWGDDVFRFLDEHCRA